jgi:hypothetical protein
MIMHRDIAIMALMKMLDFRSIVLDEHNLQAVIDKLLVIKPLKPGAGVLGMHLQARD